MKYTNRNNKKFIIKEITNILQTMNERDKKRNNQINYEINIDNLSRNERRTLSLESIIKNNEIEKPKEYERYKHKSVGILIVNLNNLNLTKNCLTSIHNQINKSFDIYLVDQSSNEEGTEEFLFDCEKNGINVIRNNENIPLNHIWNNFKSMSTSDYLCFLNNDTVLSNNFIDDTIKILNDNGNVGAVIHVTNKNEFNKAQNILNYKIFDSGRYQGWDFTIKKELLVDIPRELKIFGGDDYIFAKLNAYGYKVAIAYSSPIIHYKERTRISISNISEIQKNDAIEFWRLMREEKLNQSYSTLDDNTCNKYPPEGFELLQNKNCVYTAIIGNYDKLVPTEYDKLPDWDYICFTDNINLKSDFWRVIYVNNTGITEIDNIKLARFYKTNYYQYLSSYDNIIWIDGRITVTCNLNDYLDNLYADDNDIVFIKHPDVDSIEAEFDRVLKGKLENDEIINKIKSRYESENYQYDNGLIASGVLMFKNNERVIKFFRDWWNEIYNYSHRDQLSANYVMWKNPQLKYSVLPFETIGTYFKQLKRTKKRFRYE